MEKETQISYKISGGLKKSQIEQMTEHALDILENVGIVIPHQQTLKKLAGISGVRIDKDRVFYSSAIVTEMPANFFNVC